MSKQSSKVPIIAITPEAEEDDDHNYSNIAETLTDVETIEFDSIKSKTSKSNKSAPKLKIKLTNKDGAITDIEDVEASDGEEEFEVRTPTIDDVAVDYYGSCKETHKMKSTSNKGKKVLHTQSSTTTDATANMDDLNDNLEAVLTDMEDCYASDNEQNQSECPETVITKEMLESSINTVISDDVVQLKHTKSCVDNKENYLSKHFSDTDSENGDKSCNRKLRRRRPKSESSKTNSQHLFDNSNKSHIPIYKQRNCKNRNNKEDVLTDIETIDENENSSKVTSTNNDKSNNNHCNRKFHRQQHCSKRSDSITDSEDCFKKQEITIKFMKRCGSITGTKKNLTISKSDDDTYTDVEIIRSTEDEGDSTEIPMAIIKKDKQEVSTDNESLDASEVFAKSESYPDVSLPQPFRKQYSLIEKEAGRPAVTITPIHDNHMSGLFSKYESDVSTDEESLSDTEALLYAEALSRGATPEFSIFDGAYEEISERINDRRYLRSPSPYALEGTTDTEDITLHPDKPKRKSVNKFLSTLTVGRNDTGTLTDTEDLYLSDYSQTPITKLVRLDNEALTDTENVVVSDDEYLSEKVDLKRALSTTPTCMREIGGETVLTKEGVGRFPSTAIANLNRRILYVDNAISSPMLTDTEDIVDSGDEDVGNYSRAETATPQELHKEYDDCSSSKVLTQNTKKINIDAPEVMYLKGGSYRDVHTDVEDMDLSDDEYYDCDHKKKVSVDILGDDKVLVSMKMLCNNLKDCPMPLTFKSGKGKIRKVDARDSFQLSSVEPVNTKIYTTEFIVNLNDGRSKFVTVLYWEIPFNVTIPYNQDSFYLVGNTTIVHDLSKDDKESDYLEEFAKCRSGMTYNTVEKYEGRRRLSLKFNEDKESYKNNIIEKIKGNNIIQI